MDVIFGLFILISNEKRIAEPDPYFYPEGPCIKKEGTRGWKYYLTKTRKAGENCEDTCWKDPDCMLATFDNSKIGSRNNCFLYGPEMIRTTNRPIEDKKFTSYECKTGKLSK